MRFYARMHQRVEQSWWQAHQPNVMVRMLAKVYHYINQSNLTQRVQRQIVPPIPLISVGNITVGGSGKTPFIIWLSQQLKQEGWQPVVLCRGDGGSSQDLRHVQRSDTALHVGDEAKMLAEQCPCPVIRGKDRVQASFMAAALGDVILLDDGFQYRQLKATLDIVLVPHEGVGNACMLPAGPMREPVSSLERADMLVRTGGRDAKKISSQKEWWWCHQPSHLQDIRTHVSVVPKQVFVLTSIARPQRFISSLQSCSIEVLAHAFFPDHHAFCVADIQTCLHLDVAVAVTSKDAVKLIEIWPINKPLWVLIQEVSCEQGLLDKIKTHMLRAKKEISHVG